MLLTLQKKISISLIVTLLISLLGLFEGPLTPTAHAAAGDKALSILEIKDLDKPSTGEASVVTSDLANLLKSDSNFQLETMSIKKFVASRDELDGKYDAIYFGNSLFNPKVETGNDHNTRYKENDITLLKANEIKNKYITKGLPVIVYGDSAAKRGALYQGKKNDNSNGNLYTLFNAYNTTPNQSSVIFVTKTDLASKDAFLTKTKLLTNPTNRPRINVTSKPVDYTLAANRASQYTPGSTLSYSFDVKNVSSLTGRNLVANLYLGIDSVLTFDAAKLVQSVTVTSLTNNSISFTLPKGYSGLYYWRLELVDQTSTGRLKDAASGVFRFKDQAPTINVLQVLPNSQSIAKTSSLLKNTNMNQSYLKTDDYNINITVTDFTSFNSTEYSTLNSTYDMVIFGFNDSYNGTGNISNTAAAAVKTYIGTGQGVMFTHDTVYQGNDTWITNFKEITGQSGSMTNMGLNAPNPSTTTVKVNEGLLTEFPYFISEMSTQVATTHDQYFKLNLEDPAVIPWYNIDGGTSTTPSPRDIEDSWNHYYTYSKGNVTYSGTGHNFVNTSVNSTFPDWEQKLFVNTMYRAFIGSNHKPTLDILSPVAFNATSKNYISANSDISLSFKPDDLDLNDKNLTSSVTFKYIDSLGNSQTKSMLNGLQTKKGETINRTFTNPLATTGGYLTISVSTQDASGALETKEVIVNVITSTSLTPERTISSEKSEVNLPVTINYVIKPTAKAYSAATNLSDLTISGLHFKEVFPPYLDIVTLPANLTNVTKTGTLATGYTVQGDILNIPYRKEGNQFVADNSSFTVVVKPTSSGDYSLSNGNLSYNDYASNNQNVLFTNRVFTAFIKITSLSLDNVIIANGDSTKLIPKILPANATYKTNEDFNWASDDTTTVTVNASGVINGLKAGTAHITATAKDGSGLVATSVVSIIQPGLNITGPTQVAVNSSINLTAALVTVNEEVTSTRWSSSDTSIANFTAGSINANIGQLQGNKKGTVTVTATVTTDKGRTYSKNYDVSVFIPVSSVTLDNKTVRVGETAQLSPNYWPSNADYPTFTWSSNRTDLVTVDGAGNVTGKAVGSSTINATSTDGSNKSSNATVTVMQPTFTVTGPSTVNINEKITLTAQLTTVNEETSTVTWTPDSQVNASFAMNGDLKRDLTGLNAGTVIGTVTVRTNKGNTYTAPFYVTVRAVPITSITLLSGTIRVGETKALSPVILPENASNKSLTWVSSIPGNVSVDQNGNVTGRAAGSSTITATARDGSNISATAVITVMQPTLIIDRPSSYLQVGASMTLTGVLTTINEVPFTPLIDSIKWASPQKDVPGFIHATEDEDQYKRVITGISPGIVQASIAIETDKGSKYNASTSVTVLILSLDDRKLDIGNSAQLTPIINPVGTIPSNFDWTSSDPTIVKVDQNGKVEALKLGSATIFIVSKTDRTLSTSAVITVITPGVHFTLPNGALNFDGKNDLLVDETLELIASFESTNQTVVPGSVNWTVNDPTEQFVKPSDGSDIYHQKYKGLKTGTVTGTITLIAEHNESHIRKSYEENFTINITNPIKRVVITKAPNQIILGSSSDIAASINPSNADPSDFKWSVLHEDGSDGSDFATLTPSTSSEVKLKGEKEGYVIVKVEVGGKSDTKTIEIKEVISSIDLTDGPIRMYVDSTLDLLTPLVVFPIKFKDSALTLLDWEIDGPQGIISLQNGIVKAEHVGTVIITVKDKTNPSLSDSVKIIVEERAKFQNKY